MPLTEALGVIWINSLRKCYAMSVMTCMVFAKGTGIFMVSTIVVLAAMLVTKRQILTVMPRPLSLAAGQRTQICFIVVNCQSKVPL